MSRYVKSQAEKDFEQMLRNQQRDAQTKHCQICGEEIKGKYFRVGDTGKYECLRCNTR